jgi:hypothetical protein
MAVSGDGEVGAGAGAGAGQACAVGEIVAAGSGVVANASREIWGGCGGREVDREVGAGVWGV